MIGALKNRHKRALYTELYRAPTNNDIHLNALWKLRGYDRYKIGKAISKIKQTADGWILTFSYLLYRFVFPIASVKDRYVLHSDGKIELDTTCRIFGKEIMLPRIGKVVELKKEFEYAEYYGRGEMENYPDMKEHAKVGIFKQKADFAPKMIVPQTGGEKCDVRWAEITDEKGTGIRIEAKEKAFMLNVNHFCEADLCKWKHIVDYKDADATYVTIDGFMCGIGSNSCGPFPEKKYRIPRQKEYTFGFVLSPVKK